MSRYVERGVTGPLSPAVARLWSHEGRDLAGQELALPSGLCQILVHLGDGPGIAFAGTEGILVQGPCTRPSPIWRADQARIVGASLRPGGLRVLLGPVAAELAEQDVALEVLIGRPEAARIRERLVACPSPEARLDALHDELLGWWVEAPDHRLARALRGLAEGSIGAVARDVGLSERRLTLWFTARVGLTPKRFARVRRFQRVLAPILAGGDLGGIAHACGYFDQSHLNREFRAFAGVTPTEYRERGPRFPNHLPDVGFVQADDPEP